MATLTRHPPPQRSLLDPVQGERRVAPRFPTRFAQAAAPAGTRAATPPLTHPARPAAVRSTDATLDDLVAGMWDSLQATHAAECLACGAEVTPRFGSGPHPVAATCRSCGSQLS